MAQLPVPFGDEDHQVVLELLTHEGSRLRPGALVAYPGRPARCSGSVGRAGCGRRRGPKGGLADSYEVGERMLKRMVLMGAQFGALGVALQAARAWLSDSQPWWDPGVVAVMVVVGALGVYLDNRRGGRARHSCVY